MDEILYMTSLTAAEAVYEIDPCERIEKWWDSVKEPHNDQKNSKTFLGKFLGKLGKYRTK